MPVQGLSPSLDKSLLEQLPPPSIPPPLQSCAWRPARKKRGAASGRALPRLRRDPPLNPPSPAPPLIHSGMAVLRTHTLPARVTLSALAAALCCRRCRLAPPTHALRRARAGRLCDSHAAASDHPRLFKCQALQRNSRFGRLLASIEPQRPRHCLPSAMLQMSRHLVHPSPLSRSHWGAAAPRRAPGRRAGEL
ncbi:MAG: hypothetical protein J3K34DRAFT_443468 [Monoraphidium minutum]|nr:MAG: hypothetical protein J3K34DRAFT_443468 [Monoraphidium minutum]